MNGYTLSLHIENKGWSSSDTPFIFGNVKRKKKIEVALFTIVDLMILTYPFIFITIFFPHFSQFHFVMVSGSSVQCLADFALLKCIKEAF